MVRTWYRKQSQTWKKVGKGEKCDIKFGLDMGEDEGYGIYNKLGAREKRNQNQFAVQVCISCEMLWFWVAYVNQLQSLLSFSNQMLTQVNARRADSSNK